MNRAPPRRSPQTILLGIALVARGRAEGVALFGDTPRAFLAGLAPLLAFPLVGALLLVLGGRVGEGLTAFAESVCVLLAEPVISEALATRWGRGDLWLRYATAFNWCQWIIPLLASALVIAADFLITLGLPPTWVAPLLVVVIGVYALWLQWFLTQQALCLSWQKAIAMVVLVNLASGVLLLAPRLIGALA